MAGYNLSTVLVAQTYDARFDSLFMLKTFFIDMFGNPFEFNGEITI